MTGTDFGKTRSVFGLFKTFRIRTRTVQDHLYETSSSLELFEVNLMRLRLSNTHVNKSGLVKNCIRIIKGKICGCMELSQIISDQSRDRFTQLIWIRLGSICDLFRKSKNYLETVQDKVSYGRICLRLSGTRPDRMKLALSGTSLG